MTKADAEAVANKQLEASDKIAQAVHQGAAANVTATDKVATAVWEAGKKATEATDKVSTSVWESGKKQIEATDKVTAAVDKSRGELSGKMSQMIEKQNSMLGAQNSTNSKLDEIKAALEATEAKTAAQTAADAAVTSASTASAAAVTAINGLMPTAPTVLGYSPPGGGSDSFLQVQMPAAFGGATVNFNPFANAAMADLASWFKLATEWVILVLFGRYVFERLYTGAFEIGAAQQARGNAVFGGTGAQATAAANAAIMTAAAVVVLTSLISWTFGGISIPGLVSEMSVNPFALGGGMPSNVYWFLSQFLPIETAVIVFVARAAYPLYAAGVFAVYVTICRWLIA